MVGKAGIPYVACEIDACPGTWDTLLEVLEYSHATDPRHGRGRYWALIDRVEEFEGSWLAVNGYELWTLWQAMSNYKFDYRDTDRIDRWFLRAEYALTEAARAARSKPNARCTDSQDTPTLTSSPSQTELTEYGDAP